jgi:predicted phosphohydrolase
MPSLPKDNWHKQSSKIASVKSRVLVFMVALSYMLNSAVGSRNWVEAGKSKVTDEYEAL